MDHSTQYLTVLPQYMLHWYSQLVSCALHERSATLLINKMGHL